jgi:S-adenosyl-L-methionine hydrolase (adenosine-forming)
VGPDNGIVTFLIEQAGGCEAVEIQPQGVPGGSISNTFLGRDVFAPAAARLCNGEPVSALGPALDSPVRIPLPVFRGGEEGWEGEILYRDHFGNAVTSIGRIAFDLGSLQPWLTTGARAGMLSSSARVELANGNRVPLGRTYAEADNPTGCVGLAGSNGLLEIASWNQQTPDTRALRPGAAVRLISSR